MDPERAESLRYKVERAFEKKPAPEVQVDEVGMILVESGGLGELGGAEENGGRLTDEIGSGARNLSDRLHSVELYSLVAEAPACEKLSAARIDEISLAGDKLDILVANHLERPKLLFQTSGVEEVVVAKQFHISSVGHFNCAIPRFCGAEILGVARGSDARIPEAGHDLQGLIF